MKRAVTCLAAIAGLLIATPALADGDAAAGEKVFKKCKACHAVGDGAKNKIGPVLNGVVGRPAGQIEGYKYSKSMTETAEGGLVWNNETLTAFLNKPKEVVPKTKMSFAGLRKEKDIENVIAYLETFQ